MAQILIPGADGHVVRELTGEVVTIGRHSDNVIVLDDVSVSGHHAKITKSDSHFNVVDLNSSNGTLVNGQKITDTRLNNGDIIQFGRVEISYLCGIDAKDQPESIASDEKLRKRTFSEFIASFTQGLHQAAAIGKMQARRKKLELVDLRSADFAIGSKAFKLQLARNHYTETYQEVERLNHEIAEKRKIKTVVENATIGEKATHAAINAKERAQLEGNLIKRKNVLTKLGKLIREGGADYQEVQEEINSGRLIHERITALGDDIKSMETSSHPLARRPWLLAVGAFLLLLLTMAVYSSFLSPAAKTKQLVKQIQADADKATADALANVRRDMKNEKDRSDQSERERVQENLKRESKLKEERLAEQEKQARELRDETESKRRKAEVVADDDLRRKNELQQAQAKVQQRQREIDSGNLAWSADFYADSANGFCIYADGDNLYIGEQDKVVLWDGIRFQKLGADDESFYGPVLTIIKYQKSLFAGSDRGLQRWDGNRWKEIKCEGEVHTLASDGKHLFVGGKFESIDGAQASNIAYFDGKTWSAMDEGIAGEVNSMATSKDGLYVVGKFSSAGNLAVNSVAKWANNRWEAVGPRLSSESLTIEKVAIAKDGIYIAGSFEISLDDKDATKKWYDMLRFNGNRWEPLPRIQLEKYQPTSLGTVEREVINRNITALLPTPGGLVLACESDSGPVSSYLNNIIYLWDGTKYSMLGNGIPTGTIKDMVLYNGNVTVVGNNFSSAGKVERVQESATNSSVQLHTLGNVNAEPLPDGLAIVRNQKWQPLAGRFGLGIISSGGGHSQGYRVHLSPYKSGFVFSCDEGIQAGGIRSGGISYCDGQQWTAMDPSYQLCTVGSPEALALYKNQLVAFANFDGAAVGRSECGSTFQGISCYDGQVWRGLGEPIDGTVEAICEFSGKMIVGGEFKNEANKLVQNIAMLDGEKWVPLGSGIGGKVHCIAASGNALYVGGEFISAGDHVANNIAMWDGAEWELLGAGLDGKVQAVFPYSDRRVLAVGKFKLHGEKSETNIAEWNGKEWRALINEMEGEVRTIATWKGELFVAGNFKTLANLDVNNIARWDGKTWHQVGSGCNEQIDQMVVSGDKLIVGGHFQFAGGHESLQVGVIDLNRLLSQ